MRKIVRYYKPGKTVNLYDAKLHTIFRGELINKPSAAASNPGVGFFGKLTLASIVIAIMLAFYIVAPIALAQILAKASPVLSKTTTVQTPTDPKLVTGNYTVQDQNPGVYDFRIIVPKINLESGIVPNVDMNSEQSYLDSLKFGVAHANGSYYPGQDGLVYLFAHSTDTVANIARYNAKFFYLNTLENGDEVDISFNNKMYRYVVTGKEVIDPKNIEVIRQKKTGLILQTCWPPGTDWQRLIVYASLKQS